jgi:vacuolar-type H+-ATPase subunit D/Vma8
LRGEADAARAALDRAVADAQAWWDRAALVGGRRGARLADAATRPASASVTSSTRLGVVRPHATVTVGEPRPGLVGAGGSALGEAARHYRDAVLEAAGVAALEEAHRRVTEELARTTRRLRAIEWRWLPLHRQALATLELALDEAERVDAARVRWAVRARGAAPGR